MKWRETIVFLIIALGSVSVVVCILWMILARQLKPKTFDEKKDFIQLIAQILGGATIIITLFSTWYSVRENERKTEESALAAQQNLGIAIQTLKETHDKQIADRYSRAAEQLGNHDQKFRVGAIYGLQQIANEPNEFYSSVVPLLTSYVVENATWNKITRPGDQMPADIQAAFNVLAWRKQIWGHGEDRRLELHGLDLRGLILKNKEGDTDSGAHLEGAQLWNSHFESRTTNLRYAHLEDAVLTKANLEGATLTGSFLQGADLNGANLYDTELSAAKIKPEQVSLALNYECACYNTDFEQALLEYKKKDSQELSEYVKKRHACEKDICKKPR
jgi:hypothetical protein